MPLVLAVNGLDSRKEDLTESFSAILPFGVGYLAVDGPGTGQNPIKVSENCGSHALARARLHRNRGQRSTRTASPCTA